MDKLYRFSPITSEATFDNAVDYIIDQLERLSEKLFNEKLPITTVKVFPHFLEEYDYLSELVAKKGPKSSYGSSTSFYVEVDLRTKGYSIKYLGVRIVDPYRMHVGCGDYEIENFEEFKKRYRNMSPFIRDFRGEMIELWHPEFDVLGYIISKG